MFVVVVCKENSSNYNRTFCRMKCEALEKIRESFKTEDKLKIIGVCCLKSKKHLKFKNIYYDDKKKIWPTSVRISKSARKIPSS